MVLSFWFIRYILKYPGYIPSFNSIVWSHLNFSNSLTSSDRKSTRLNSSHLVISYAVFCLKKKKINLLVSMAELYHLPTKYIDLGRHRVNPKCGGPHGVSCAVYLDISRRRRSQSRLVLRST